MADYKQWLSDRDALKYSYNAPLSITQCKVAVQVNLTVFFRTHILYVCYIRHYSVAFLTNNK